MKIEFGPKRNSFGFCSALCASFRSCLGSLAKAGSNVELRFRVVGLGHSTWTTFDFASPPLICFEGFQYEQFFNMVNADSEMTDAILLAGQNTDGVAVVESSLKELKNALYARCANQPAERVFDQNDLFDFGIIPNNDLGQLLLCVKQLTQDGLFKVQKKDERACWKVVKKEDAARYNVFHPPTPPSAHPIPQIQNAQRR